MNNFGYGNLIELHSVASFLIWDLVPNLAFFGALTIFLSTIVRSRIVVHRASSRGYRNRVLVVSSIAP